MSTLHDMDQGHSLHWPIFSLRSVHLTLAMRLHVLSLSSGPFSQIKAASFGSLVPWLLLSAPSLPSPKPPNKLSLLQSSLRFLYRVQDLPMRTMLIKHGLQQRGLLGPIHATLTPPHPYFPKPPHYLHILAVGSPCLTTVL